MIGFDLLRPAWFWLPLGVLVLQLVGLWGLRRARQRSERLVVARQRSRFAPHASRVRAGLRLALASAAFFLLGVSFLGPVRGYTTRETVRRGLDLVVCIDTSRSMLAEDLRPNRLERARREVRGLLGKLRGDRVGLVAFSGDARDIAPLTHDRATLDALLDYVSPADNLRGGTDIAAALQYALDLFDGRTGSHEAICLLTDGEDLEGRAAAVAEKAAARGIRIFLVGIGTEAGSKIPFTTADGREGFLRGPDGEEVVTRLDGTSLEAIAETTGGAYLSVEMSPTPLEDLYAARIATLEGREYEGGERRIPHDRFQWTLALAVACMLLEVSLREKRSSRAVARGAQPRSSAMSKSRVALMLPLVLTPNPTANLGVDSGALPRVARQAQNPQPPVAGAVPAGAATPPLVPSAASGQAPAPAPDDATATPEGEQDAPALPPPLPDFAPLFQDFRAAVAEGEGARAVELAAPYLEARSATDTALERQRAALRFGLGLVRGQGEDVAVWPEAVDDFHAATALAGPGALRLDALYDAGVVELQEGERQRALLPEVAGGGAQVGAMPALGPGMAPGGAPGLPGGPGAAGEEQEDPLQLARDAYQRARKILTQRLKSDWRDVDTRANLELVQRRLKELDDIERQREEQEQQQQDQQQDSQQDQDDQQEQDQDQNRENEREQDEPDPSQQDEDGDEAEPNEEPSEEEPSESDEQQDPGEEEQQEPSEGEGSEEPQELEPPQATDEQQQANAEPLDTERHLTKEEVMRLLDQLEKIDEQARATEARLRRAQRKPVERDW